MPRTLLNTFNSKNLGPEFKRQHDYFSRAAAICATATKLYGLDESKNLKFFQKEFRLKLTGTNKKTLEKQCSLHLPVEKIGINIYHGGIAVAIIEHKPAGGDHAVLFLARKDNIQIYYDPLDHRIYSDHIRNMRRGSYGAWTANLPEIPRTGFDFWSQRAEANPFILRQQAFWLKERALR